MNTFRRKKDSFYVILKGSMLCDTEMKYSFVDSNPRSMDYEVNSTAGLSDLLMNGHKISVGPISSTKGFVYRSIRYTQLSENDLLL